MHSSNGKEHNPILSRKPPEELIPEGYNRKVIIMWLSFFGMIFGAANLGGPLFIILPVSTVIFLAHLIMLIFSRLIERPVWLYKEAQESYYSKRYDKTLAKLEKILELRPDMEDKLLPALLVCRSRTGDMEGAKACYEKLVEKGQINADSNNLLLVEILKVLKHFKWWDRMLEVAGCLPEGETYNDLKHYYLGLAYSNTGQHIRAKDHFSKISNDSSFPDLDMHKIQLGSNNPTGQEGL